MKIGRNSCCPCGSGKKYKKCCMRKDTVKTDSANAASLSTLLSDFSHISSNALSVNKIIRKYVFEDVIIAAFCINLWRRNRSALEQSLTLNLAIAMGGSFGQTQIKTFEEFGAFYNDIAEFLKVTGYEDDIVDDYGEVFISHLGKSYSVIIGTGHQQVYGALRYLQTLSDVCNRQAELTDLLEYSNTILAFTHASNISNASNEIAYELPSSDFWICITNLFHNPDFVSQMAAASKIVGHQDSPIEMRHFVKRDGCYFPLYNASILLDFYKILLDNATENEKDDHVWLTIHSLLENSYNFSPNTPNRILIQPFAVNRETQKKVVEKDLIFAGFANDTLVIGLENGSNNIKGIIGAIDQLKADNKLHLIESHYRQECHGVYGVEIKPEFEIIYILIDPFTDILSHGMFLEERSNHFKCTALDMLYFIGFADNFSEIADFIRYYSALEAKMLTFGGKNTVFFSWKNANHQIAPGAYEYDYITTDFNETENYVLTHFSQNLCEFPRTGKGLFIDPLNWHAEDSELGYKKLFHKGCSGFGGDIRRLTSDISIFLAHNVQFFIKEDFEHNAHTALKTIDELNQRLFDRYADILTQVALLKEKTLHLLFMPWAYAQQHHSNTFLNDTRELVYSDEYIEDGSFMIRYSVDPDVIMEAIRTAPDRRTECIYFKELLQPVRKYDPDTYQKLLNKLEEDSPLKKTVGVFFIEQQYYFSDEALDTTISAVDFTKARKEIAQMCLASGVQPGEYRGQDATNVVRTLQATIIKVFEDYLSEIDMLDLHKKILNYYAIQQNGVIQNMKRYFAFTDLDEEVQAEFESKTRSVREEYRCNVETAKYLLESNLFVKHKEGAEKCTKSKFSFLLAFADWLVVLQNDSDTSHFAEFDITIAVDTEYRIITMLNEDAQQRTENMVLRKYNGVDYHIKNDADDMIFFEKAINAFQEDTGIDFRLMVSLAEFMQLGIVEERIAEEIYPNVFAVDETMLAQRFNEILEQPVPNIDIIVQIIKYLTVTPELLKTTDGTQHNYLPIWEREKRDNRFETKPILKMGNLCIFSPVAMNNLYTQWRNGLADWFPPYEIGLTNLLEVLAKWKKRYEDEMVQDIAQLFRAAKFDVVIPELKLYDRFPADNYPEWLGDYDVFAINHTSQEIWIVESKVLQKIGSIHEDQMQQKGFFVQGKYDKKFQRRIDYLNNNYKKVLSSMKLDISEYRIIPYMVTNKLFVAKYKKINFPIITYSELQEKLQKTFGLDLTAHSE